MGPPTLAAMAGGGVIRWMSFLLGSWAAGLSAAVPGAPEPLVPDLPPDLQISWHNDVFGGEVGDNPDDFRTNGVRILWRMGDEWLLAADYSNLTNRLRIGDRDFRADEVSLSINRSFLDHRFEAGRVWMAGGFGLRVSGDIGGDQLQNAWHELFSFLELDLPYETRSTHPLGSLGWHAEAKLGKPFDRDMVLGAGARLQVANTGGMVVTDVEWQMDSTTRVVVASADAMLWTGLRLALRAGQTANQTSAVVADQEDGVWLTMGGAVAGFFAEASFNLDTDLSAGWLGWRSDYQRHPDWFGGDHLIAEVGPVIGDFAIDVGLRWQPAWQRGLGRWGERSHLLGSYAWGHVPNVEFANDDASIRYQQIVLGWDLAFRDEDDRWLDWTPFTTLAVGYRTEEVTPERFNGLFPRDSAASAVIEAGLGIRALFGPPPEADGVRYGLSAAYQYRWVPGSATFVDRFGHRHEYLNDNGDLHLRLILEVGW